MPGPEKGRLRMGVINFGQFRLRPALSFEFGQFDDFSQFDFGQFRLRQFLDVELWDDKMWARRVGAERVT